MFQCPEPGLYMFTFTVCTFDGKKCLLMLKKNDQDVCALIDQDGNENRGKTMISQTCMLELEVSDRVQVNDLYVAKNLSIISLPLGICCDRIRLH